MNIISLKMAKCVNQSPRFSSSALEDNQEILLHLKNKAG